MLLKYSFNDIRREKRLLDVEQCSVTVNERNYTLTVITKTPHRLRPNDIVLLKHNIVTVEYYSDAVDYLSKHSVDIIFVKKQETLIEKDVNTPRFFCINSLKTIAIVYGSSPLEHDLE